MSIGTAMEPLGIVFTELGPDYLRGTMPVDKRTLQPYGLLHGGASVLLAETRGSTAAMLYVRWKTEDVMAWVQAGTTGLPAATATISRT